MVALDLLYFLQVAHVALHPRADLKERVDLVEFLD
jgi:hypothetical protein